MGDLRVVRLLPRLGPAPADAQPVQQGAEPLAADRGHDLLLDEVVAQFAQRPASHADQGYRAGDGDLGYLLQDGGPEAARFTGAARPGIPGDAVEAVLVEAVDDDPHPLRGAVAAGGDVAVADAAPAEQDDPGVPTVDRTGLLPLQPVQLLLFVRPQGSYLDLVHGPSPRFLMLAHLGVETVFITIYLPSGIRRETAFPVTALVECPECKNTYPLPSDFRMGVINKSLGATRTATGR